MFSSLNIRIGFFLARRQVRRSSPWTTVLIIFVMFFTFLNLVVVSGILVGLIQGAIVAVRSHYTSDVIVSSLNNKTYIENSPEILNIIKYLPIDSPGFTTLRDVAPGTKIRVKVHGVEREVTIKGIIKAKVDEVSMRVFMIDSELRSLIGRNDYNVDEISIKLKPGTDPATVRDILKRNGVDRVAKVQTYVDAQPKFIKDMVDTFALLGNMLSSIGLVVASITIFIVIFINAITRRKFIGILKGIGINERAIEISYILQSFFYAFCGSVIGVLVLYVFLQPAIAAHPIDFPFSDGILVAPVSGTVLRIALLMATTIIAGFIPARLIVRKNTLDSILGRN